MSSDVFAQSGVVSMSLQPDSGQYQTGELFTTDVWLDTGGKGMITAEARLKYDSEMLEVKEVLYGGLSGQYADVVRVDKGTIAIILLRVSTTTWNDIFASVRFKALKSGITNLELIYDITEGSEDSSVYSLETEDDLLESVRGATYSLQGETIPTPTFAPTVMASPTSLPTPTIQPEIESKLKAAAALPNTSIAHTTYILAGMATMLLLTGARLAVVRA